MPSDASFGHCANVLLDVRGTLSLRNRRSGHWRQCIAACGDIFPAERCRNRAIGIVNSAFSLGAIFGLPVVALTADLTDWRLAIALPAPLALLVVAGTGRLPTSQTARPVGSVWASWRAGYSRVIQSAETIALLATCVLLMVVWFGWLIYFGAFTEDVYGTSAALLSLMFLFGGGAEMSRIMSPRS